MLSQEAAARQRSTQDLNLEDLRGDTDLEKLHCDRLAELQREVEKRQVKQRRGHGEYQVRWVVAPLQVACCHGERGFDPMQVASRCSLHPWGGSTLSRCHVHLASTLLVNTHLSEVVPHPQEVKEADFLDTVTQTQQVVCHFWHSDFMRCKIMDKHLQQLAPQHFDTRFIKVSAAVRLLSHAASLSLLIVLPARRHLSSPAAISVSCQISSIWQQCPQPGQSSIAVNLQEAPFFTEKLNVRVLPCVIVFINGVAVERLVGFDTFGNRDDFKTGELLQWLVQAGGVAPQARQQSLMRVIWA